MFQLTYSLKQASDLTGISQKAITEALRKDNGPILRKIGNRTLITHLDLMAWLNSLPTYKEIKRAAKDGG
jgi:hypothetical protein